MSSELKPPSDHQLAELCLAAYDEDGPPGFERIGVYGPEAWIKVDNASSSAVLVFVGTDDLADVLVDTAVWMVPFGKFGRVHAGFARWWASMNPSVLERVVSSRTVTVAGHSLGGAMAKLAAVALGSRASNRVTFGAPRVGDAEVTGKLADGRDYALPLDPVPWLPLRRWGYMDSNQTVVLDSDWRTTCEDLVRKVVMAANPANWTVNRWLRTLVEMAVDEHYMTKYLTSMPGPSSL